MEKCNHNWHYLHDVWEGRNENEAAICRFCPKCKKTQMSYVSKWKAIPKKYSDMKDLCLGST